MHDAIHALFTSYAFQQTAPFVVLFVVPAFALLARVHWQTLACLVRMVLESLLPWNWGGAVVDASSESGRKSRKSHARSKSGQAKMNGSAVHSGG
jgi:hypothetical protein